MQNEFLRYNREYIQRYNRNLKGKTLLGTPVVSKSTPITAFKYLYLYIFWCFDSISRLYNKHIAINS